MTDTPDVQKIAEKAVNLSVHLDENANCDGCNDAAAAVLSAVEPVIRRKVAEEIIDEIEKFALEHDDGGREAYGLDQAAVIARSHATEEKPA